MMNKKALSEMVGYVILVVIAIALSVAVYSFLKSYVPVDMIECPVDMSLIVQNYSCYNSGDGYKLQLVLTNKGLFNINAAYLRLGPENRKVKFLVNDALAHNGVYLFDNNVLNPGQSITTQAYDVSRFVQPVGGNYGLEVQPAIFKGENIKLALCANSIITQTIVCP